MRELIDGHPVIAWFIVLAFLAGCVTKHDAGNPDEKQPEVSVAESAPVKDAVLYRNEIVHEFSSPNEKDSLKILVVGQSITEGEVTFEIKSSERRIIHQETFPAAYLLGYGYTGNTDEEASA